MQRLNFAEASFDLVACLEGIEHVPVEIGQKFIKESYRVLRPNGLLMLTSPFMKNKQHSGNPYHVHEYQPDELQAALEKVFHIEDVIYRQVAKLTVMCAKCIKK